MDEYMGNISITPYCRRDDIETTRPNAIKAAPIYNFIKDWSKSKTQTSRTDASEHALILSRILSTHVVQSVSQLGGGSLTPDQTPVPFLTVCGELGFSAVEVNSLYFPIDS